MLLPQIIEKISTVILILVFLLYAYQTIYLVTSFFIRKKPQADCPPHRFAILIAARNEAEVLPDLLKSIQRQDYPREFLDCWVVADNCTDETARLAKENGAYVAVRSDKTHIGKGYALNYLLETIRRKKGLDGYDAYLVIDADNVLTPDYVSQMNQTYSQGYDAFCGYRNSKNYGSSAVAMAQSIWYLHESTHLNRSRNHYGVPCMVSGTGFGFSKELLEQCGGWQFFTLTEDLEFSLWCSTHGIRVGYNHNAVLYDEQPITLAQSWRQRTRWIQGGIQLGIRNLKQIFHGLLRGGATTYATLEALSLSMWGFVLGTLCGLLSTLSTVLNHGWQAALSGMVIASLTAVFVALLTAALTVATEWDRIHATKKQKILSIFTFPFYIITYLPIAVGACFTKFSWPPIEHTEHIAEEELIS